MSFDSIFNAINMNNYRYISQSITLVDNVFEGMPQTKPMTLTQESNPFQEFCTPKNLKIITDTEFAKLPNSDIMHREFISKEGDVSIIFEMFPPILIFRKQENMVSDISSPEKIKSIVLKIIEKTEIQEQLGKIWFKYEIFIPDKDIKLNEILLPENLKNTVSRVSSTLIFTIDDYTELNLRISDVIIGSDKGIYLDANFSNKIDNTNNPLDAIFKKDFITIIRKKIEALVPANNVVKNAK